MRLLQQQKQPALFSQSMKQYEIQSLKALMVRGVLAEGCQDVVEGVEGAEGCVDDQQLYVVSIHTMIQRCYLCRLLKGMGPMPNSQMYQGYLVMTSFPGWRP